MMRFLYTVVSIVDDAHTYKHPFGWCMVAAAVIILLVGVRTLL